MDTVIVKNSQFYSHCQKRIAKGTVNAEHVEIRLDSEWDGLTARIHWLNVASNVERKPLLERDQPNTIPWEVLEDLGELRMGLVGLDGETVIKPTIWLTYGYVADGVDPESGSDPQPPTPSWEQQMVEQARVAAEAAEAAKDAAVNAEKAASQSGPYADEAKKSAEAAKEAQRAASTSAKQAANAKDQANIASDTAKGHADAAGAAKVEAERAAEMAGNAKSGAAQSAQASENSAKASEAAKQEAQKAASIFPKITPEDAGKVLMVSENGEKIVTGDVSGGGKIDDTTLRRNTTWSSLKIVDSLAPEFESSGPVVTCNPVPGYPLSVTSQIVPVQDGEGDPSPDNIRPISGYTGAKIKITGKNLFDVSKIEDVAGKLVNNGDGTITVTTPVGDSSVNTGKTIRELVGDIPPGDYYLNAETTATVKQIYLLELKSAWRFNQTRRITSADLDSTISFYASGSNATATISDIYLSPATLSGPYVPYRADSKAFSVAFEDTVYGGTLDWTTGVLTVEQIGVVIDGTQEIAKGSTVAKRHDYTISLPFQSYALTTPMCDKLPGKAHRSLIQNDGAYGVATRIDQEYEPAIWINVPASENTVDAVNTWLASNPLTVVYKVADPIAIQLTPTEILALSGTNTLYTNTGDTTVVGRADPGATIKDLLARIDALEKAAIGGV